MNWENVEHSPYCVLSPGPPVLRHRAWIDGCWSHGTPVWYGANTGFPGVGVVDGPWSVVICRIGFFVFFFTFLRAMVSGGESFKL